MIWGRGIDHERDADRGLREIDVPEDEALRAAAAAKSEDETTRSFGKRDVAIDKLAAAVTALDVELEGDVALPTWMVGFNVAMLVALLFRSFSH